MRFTKFLTSSFLALMIGLVAVGCNENDPVSPPDDGEAPATPTNLQAVSRSDTSVGLKWNVPSDTGTVTFSVYYESQTVPSDNGTKTGLTATTGATTATAVIGGLGTGVYEFQLWAERDGVHSDTITVQWAAAARYTQDQANTQSIKIYEFDSDFGSAITLDPLKGGPKNISVTTASTDVQLAIYMAPGANTFDIGPAFAFPEFTNVDSFDPNVVVSNKTYLAESLNAWYNSKQLTDVVTFAGNTSTLNDFASTRSDNMQEIFVVRTGASGSYNYARVMIKNDGGQVVKGTAPNRYIELEISYQAQPNLAFAKTAPTSNPASAPKLKVGRTAQVRR